MLEERHIYNIQQCALLWPDKLRMSAMPSHTHSGPRHGVLPVLRPTKLFRCRSRIERFSCKGTTRLSKGGMDAGQAVQLISGETRKESEEKDGIGVEWTHGRA